MEIKILFDTNNLHASLEKWAGIYHDPNDAQLYEENIKLSQFECDDINNLYQWKNKTVLSAAKKASLKKNIIDKIDVINKLKTRFSQEEFDNNFKNVSAVWQIFLMHIINPTAYPIYDQNIHRAYLFVTNGEWTAVDETIKDAQKLDFYHTVYIKYCQSLKMDLKTIDEGMFMLGQVLKQIKKCYESSKGLIQIT